MSRNKSIARLLLRPRVFVATAVCLLLVTPFFAANAACVVPNVGGTVILPPTGCGYISPDTLHIIIAGLPPGTTILVGVEHQEFFNVTKSPGGSLGGESEQFDSFLQMVMSGTGGLLGFHRTLSMQAQCQTDTAPRTPGDPVQSFDTDMFRIQGQLPPGDPDFDLLRITAGTGFGMPSPGHTTLTQRTDGQFNVDSFFDITYRIDFVGHPGGPLGGMSGSTTATIRMRAGYPVPPPPPPCTVVDNGNGTVDLPPDGCGYVSPADLHMMIDGLPPGTEIHVAADHDRFFNVQHQPDGTGGEVEQFQSTLELDLTGTGTLSDLHRVIALPTQCQAHTDPRDPGAPVQDFDTDMRMIQGQIVGDPDFDLLRITAGTSFGLPSPGHTTLTQLPGGNWAVDSFFDITYRIDFVGKPGGSLGGMSGSTTGTIRMVAGQPSTAGVPGAVNLAASSVHLVNSPNPFNPGTTVQYRLASPADVRLTVHDATGRIVRMLTEERLPVGPHAVLWDGRDDSGHRLASGTYFVKLAVDGKVLATEKAVLLK